MTVTQTQVINRVLNRLRDAIGTGEHPPGSNSNFIVDWYNDNVDRIGNGPWCEMTATWAMHTGGAKILKKGRAYTIYAAQDAQKRSNGSSWHWGTKGMRAGDHVYFDWTGQKGKIAVIDHVGVVERINNDGTFNSLEGNTGNGVLRREVRDGKYVVGYVRFDWNRVMMAANKKAKPPKTEDSKTEKPDDAKIMEKLEVDGELGPKTISTWQAVLGLPVTGKMGANLVKAVQKRLKETVDHRLKVDGEGIVQDGKRYKTAGALQRYLKSPVDERISKGDSKVVKALQRRLNTGRF